MSTTEGAMDIITTYKQTYLEETISSTGYINENIKERCTTVHTAISQLKSSLKDVKTGLLMMFYKQGPFKFWISVTQVEELEVLVI